MGDELRDVLREWWSSSSEFVQRSGWQQIVLTMFKQVAPVMETELPEGDGFVIFRGQGRGFPPGISWTLDPKRAAWFASRFPLDTPDHVVLRGYIERGDVLGYFTDREEAEIICDPATVRLDWESGGERDADEASRVNARL